MEKVLANRYRLTEQIGMGGMAIVYKAVDMRTGHNVAVKVLRPEFNEDAEFISRFQREAEAASKMTHHNIVNLLDVGMDGENRYLVMEYVQGKTLKEVIQERRKISAPLACQITIRILSALEHAHRNGIIHRDIKPQNILVHADGHIKVADFGIARIADSSTLTKGDNVMGSVHYFSPEQARGEGASAASDIYSTGIVLYEMLTGRVPYDGDNPVAIAMQHLHTAPIPIQSLAPDVPPAVVRVCMKAMEKNPAMRYQSARDMAADLREALDEKNGQGVISEIETEIRQPRPQFREDFVVRNRNRGDQKKRVRRILSALLVVAVVAGLAFGSRAIYRQIITTASVPDVSGMMLEEAERLIVREGLVCEPVFTASEEYAAGTVVLQNPEADKTIRKGDTVLITVSSGPATLPMPDLVTAVYTDAQNTLRGMNITQIIIDRTARGDYPPDTVVAQSPEAGTPVSREQEVVLVVSGGEVVIPDLKDKTMAEAEEMLLNMNLQMSGQIKYVDTDKAEKHGLIAGQTPDADSKTMLNTTVSLWVYRHPESTRKTVLYVTVPSYQQAKNVRVTLIAENSTVELEVDSYTVAPEDAREKPIELEMPDSRTYYYAVYVDGLQSLRAEVTDSEMLYATVVEEE